VALVSSSFAEPPAPSHSYGAPSITYSAPSVVYEAPSSLTYAAPSESYGAPEISSGYAYAPQSVHTDYYEQHVGHQTSEGLNLDANLLHKIENILIQHENSGSKIVTVPSHSYGVPQSTYGVPSHSYGVPAWNSRVVGIDFDHLRQSHQVAQFLGKDRYAPSYVSSGHSGYSSGYSSGSSSSGWNTESLAWQAPSKPSGWSQVVPSTGYTVVSSKPAGWTIAKPAGKYGVPRW
jgi:hypothetical protein